MTDNPFSAFDENDASIYIRQLIEAGCIEDVHETLASESNDGQNAWYIRWQEIEREKNVGRFRDAGYFDRYLADINRALQAIDEEIRRKIEKGFKIDKEFELLVRYQLIRASLASVANEISPNVGIALIRYGIVPPEWGLQIADLVGDSETYLGLMVAIATAEHLDSDKRVNAFEKIIEIIPQTADLYEFLENVADQLPQAVYSKLIQKIETFPEGPDAVRSRSLAALLPVLKGKERIAVARKCLGFAKDVEGTRGYAILLLTVMPYLPKAERDSLLSKAWDSISKTVTSNPDYMMWKHLIPRLAINGVKLEIIQKLLEMVKDERQRD